MGKIIILLAAIVLGSAGCGRSHKKRAENKESVVTETSSRDADSTGYAENGLNDYTIDSFDYSEIWSGLDPEDDPRDEMYVDSKENFVYQGIIGDDCRRIQIKFLTVGRSEKDTDTYNVTGKSKTGDNVCSFEGCVRIEKVVTADGEIREDADAYSGEVEGWYELFENKNERGSGVFRGAFKTQFNVYEQAGQKIAAMNRGHYDSEGCNEFLGTWTSYKTNVSKICNWGYYIPPASGKLFRHIENGVYAFNSEYLDKGWASYVSAGFVLEDFSREGVVIEIDEEDKEKHREIERKKWWVE